MKRRTFTIDNAANTTLPADALAAVRGGSLYAVDTEPMFDTPQLHAVDTEPMFDLEQRVAQVSDYG